MRTSSTWPTIRCRPTSWPTSWRIASQLILLKSRRLLPGDAMPAGLVAEDEPDEDELRRRLVEYRALRDASRVLGEWDMVRPAYRREPREADLPEARAEPMPAFLLSEALERLAAIPEPAAGTAAGRAA